MRTGRLQQIHAHRLKRLNELIAGEDFGGVVGAFATALGLKGEQVSRWRTGGRAISEESARSIEESLNLPALWFDLPDDALLEINSPQKRHSIYRLKLPTLFDDPVIRATARLMNDLDIGSRRIVHDLASNLHSAHKPNGGKKSSGGI